MEKYDRIKPLGKGSFGSAVLVRRRQDRQLFVVKEVNLARMNPREREEARNECKVLQLLVHPNVIRYEEHFEKRSVLYIVMEYADGGDLHQKIVNQRNTLMREDNVLHYFVQMCLALDYLHGRHILHRDIKSMNIFLTSNGTVKLGDFGISTILRNTMGMANTVCGTPYYFSPELCKNKPYNNKTDVWALGVVLFEMLALKHPFDANNLNQLMQRILRNPIPRVPSAYSPLMKELVSSCLEKEHPKRPSVRSLLGKEMVRRALLRLHGDLGTASHTNQRLQQVVAERISEGAAPTGAPPAPAPAQQQQQQQQPVAQHQKPQQQQPERRPSPQPVKPQPQPESKAQQQQQQQNLYKPQVQAPVIAIHNDRRALPGAQQQQQQPPPQSQQHHDQNRRGVNVIDARRNISPVVNVGAGGGVAGALGVGGGGGGGGIPLHRPQQQQQQQQPLQQQQQQQLQQRQPSPQQAPVREHVALHAPPPLQRPKGLVERMAEMEKLRAARIQQLEKERREADEREKRDIEEARKMAALRVAENRKKAHDKAEAAVAREREERDARRKRRLPSVPKNESDAIAAPPPPSGHQQQPVSAHVQKEQVSKQIQQQQIIVKEKMGQQQQQQQQQQPQSQQQHQQDDRPAVSNAYLAHLREHQAKRQAAHDWVEREQQRRMSGGQAIVVPGQHQPPPPPPQNQKLDRDVERWLLDEQRKRWDIPIQPKVKAQQDVETARVGGVVSKDNNVPLPHGQPALAKGKMALPPLSAAVGGGGGAAACGGGGPPPPGLHHHRPMTPPPSPSNAFRPRRRLQAVEPLNNNENQKHHRRVSSSDISANLPQPGEKNKNVAQPTQNVGRKLALDNNNNNAPPTQQAPPQSQQQLRLKQLEREKLEQHPLGGGMGGIVEFTKKHEVAKKGMNFEQQQQQQPSQQQQQQQQRGGGIAGAPPGILNPRELVDAQRRRDHSAPPVISPVRHAPIVLESESTEELIGDSEFCEAVPSAGDGAGGGGGAGGDSDTDSVEAHEALVVQGAGNNAAQERRVCEYNAIGWHIQSLLEHDKNKAQKQQQQMQQQAAGNNNKAGGGGGAAANDNDDNFGDEADPEDFTEIPLEEEESLSADDLDENIHDDNNNGALQVESEDVSIVSSPPDAAAGTNPPTMKNDAEAAIKGHVNAHGNDQQQQQKRLLPNNIANIRNNNNNNMRNNKSASSFPLLHLCGGIAFSKWWQSVENTQEEAQALRGALIRRLKMKEIVAQVIQLLNMACTSVNGSDGSLAVNMYKLVEPFVSQVRKVVKQHVAKQKLLGAVGQRGAMDEEAVDCFVDEIVQTASRVVFFEGFAHK